MCGNSLHKHCVQWFETAFQGQFFELIILFYSLVEEGSFDGGDFLKLHLSHFNMISF